MTNAEKYKTTKERAEAFRRFCRESYCYDCEIYGQCNLNNKTVAFYWLDLEAPAEEPLPCPFCGGKCCVYGGENYYGEYWIQCLDSRCDYSSPSKGNSDAAIEAHNRVARIVAKEKEVNDANA